MEVITRDSTLAAPLGANAGRVEEFRASSYPTVQWITCRFSGNMGMNWFSPLKSTSKKGGCSMMFPTGFLSWTVEEGKKMDIMG